ncbi:MAG: hypothetical protein JWQ96_1208 [Segetibacter sp.]|nr:hypothetical protein [Segetibacter sp.]
MTPKDIRRKIEDWIAIVPDIKVNIITIISDKNFVLAYCSLTGIHRGNWMDIPPTGKPINIPMFNMYKIEGGKICEQWNVTNLFDVTAQMKIADMKCTIPEII